MPTNRRRVTIRLTEAEHAALKAAAAAEDRSINAYVRRLLRRARAEEGKGQV